MTDQEVQPFIGKAVRVTLADGRIIAGTLHKEDGHGHGHTHYALVSPPVAEGGQPVIEMVHGAGPITTIDDASGDPAASES